MKYHINSNGHNLYVAVNIWYIVQKITIVNLILKKFAQDNTNVYVGLRKTDELT